MMHRREGFTIVELLIVIVVIAILAAITTVAYNGIQQRARASAAQSLANQASKKVVAYSITNGSYPADLTTAEITDTTGLQYSVNNSTSPATYCITATSGNVSYYTSSTQTTPQSGGCPGHGQGGVAAITNLAANPRGVDPTASGWFRPLIASDLPTTSNVSWNSRTDWTRFMWNGTGNNTARLRLPLASLTNGTSYTSSVLLGNSGTSSMTVTLDFCDQGATTVTLAAGEMRRVSFTASRATYDATYSFLDIGLSSSNATGVLVTAAMVTQGTTSYNYADGSTANWVWNGTANASTSTGPPV